LLDRIIGLPLCRLLGRRPAPQNGSVDPAAIRRVLVIRPGGIGDMVLVLPLINALGRLAPQATITLVAEARNAAIAQPQVDNVRLYDRSPASLWAHLRATPYDVVIDTEQFHYLSAVATHLARSPVKIGFDTFGRGRLYTHPAHYDVNAYEAQNFLGLLKPLSGELTFEEDVPFMRLPEAARARAEQNTQRFGTRKPVGICMGASVRRKHWDRAKFESVARRLVDDGHPVVILGGREDREAGRTLAARIGDGVANYCGTLDLAASSAMIERCCAFLSCDSALMHIAYALGVPTLSLYGPGSARKWAPRGARHRVISKDFACSPCMTFGRIARCDHAFACMRTIEPDDVVAQLKKVIQT